MDKYCNNCGNYGHLYRSCRHPILSYGIVLYHEDEHDIKSIVMVERKDTLSFIEFLRGKYNSIYDVKYLNLLFSRLSNIEKVKLLEHDFDTLWKNLWIHTETINHRIKREYTKSKENYNQLKAGIIINEETVSLKTLIDGVKSDYDMNEWEIPKGRRKGIENNRECAIREVCEETNIVENNYDLYNNIIPLIEEYTGINGVRYKHVYYIGKIKDKCELVINMENKDQYTEIKDIKWVTEEECYHKIRDYDDHKSGVMREIFDFLKTYKKYVMIKK
jgi:8-oxo-dGTP pyrophosphatase MutT (NUDIX family)